MNRTYNLKYIPVIEKTAELGEEYVRLQKEKSRKHELRGQKMQHNECKTQTANGNACTMSSCDVI
jgi:hypothetical protein